MTALVTGSGRRLGRRIALALAESGFDLVIHYNRSAEGAEETAARIREAHSRRAITVRADVSDPDQIKKMFARIHDEFEHLDLLVNNAAVFPEPRQLGDYDLQSWDTVVNTNLRGPFFCAQEAGAAMKKRGSGQIINISSLGSGLLWEERMVYNISKAGVNMMTRVLAKTLAPEVLVNAIAPGTVIVPGEEDPEAEYLPGRDDIPAGHYGNPEDITSLIKYLAGNNHYITGQILRVDGGATLS